jgi:glycosyltransferase involved in cell wall biosynthesis
VIAEVAFNRCVHPLVRGFPGLRAYSVGADFDLVHVQNYPHHLKFQRSVPVVMSIGGGSHHHYLREYENWSDDRIERLYRRAESVFQLFGITNEMVSWRRLSGISVFSEFAASFLLRAKVPRELIHVIPPGFAPGSPARERPERPFTFLFVGRAPHRKGADLFIEAIRLMRRRGLAVRAVIAGDESYPRLAAEDGFEGYAWLGREDLYRSVYPRVDAYVLPSRAEGYGFTLIEAMSFALPVVASRQEAFTEIVREGKSGLLVSPLSAENLAGAMEALAADPDEAREMGRVGLGIFEERFTRRHFHERMLTFYQAALAR